MADLMAGSLGWVKAVAPRRFQLRLRRLSLHCQTWAMRARRESAA
ncbi:MAG: hypothetical protein ACREPA_11735 [Candidatus Dormibacteraceae bacterium]